MVKFLRLIEEAKTVRSKTVKITFRGKNRVVKYHGREISIDWCNAYTALGTIEDLGLTGNYRVEIARKYAKDVMYVSCYGAWVADISATLFQKHE